MPQGVLSYKYQEEKSPGGVTALAGLPVFLDLMRAAGLPRSIERHVKVGWTDVQVVETLLLLNLAGGECVDDLRILKADQGLAEIVSAVETEGMTRRKRRNLDLQRRKEEKRGRKRPVPSPSAVFRYLSAFHDPGEEEKRVPHTAYIPAPNAHLRGLSLVNRDFLAFVQSRSPQEKATLDMDATLVETMKAEALRCYEGYPSYQPLTTFWAEQGSIVHSEFRDGNVPAGYQQLRVLTEALRMLPPGVKRVFLRSDTAGYQMEVLRYCAEGRDERFGVIEFAIGADVTPQFKAAVAEVPESEWQPLYRTEKGKRVRTKQEWAEVCYVPNWVGHSRKGPSYRYVAIREPFAEQLEIPGAESQLSLPFPTMDFPSGGRYKLFGIVTNRDLPGEELIGWYRERCGKSEEAHSVIKEDLAGGRMPSGKFGVNAAWWSIAVLAFNLVAAMKRLAFGKGWEPKRMKAIRFHLINLPGLVFHHARQLFVRLAAGHPSLRILLEARRRILCLNPEGVG